MSAGNLTGTCAYGEVNVVDGFVMAAFAWLPKSTDTSDGPLPSSRLNFLRFNCILIELCDRDGERRSRSNSRTPFSDFQPTTQPTKSMS